MMFLLGYGPWLLSLASFVLFPKGHACPDAKETVPPNLGQSWDPFLGPQKWNITEMVKPYPAKGSYNSSNNLVPLYWCAVWPKEEPTESVRDMALAYTSLQPVQRE